MKLTLWTAVVRKRVLIFISLPTRYSRRQKQSFEL